MSLMSSYSSSKLIAFTFSHVVGFGGFLLGDARTSIVGCLPFLSFTLSLVGVSFGLGISGDLGHQLILRQPQEQLPWHPSQVPAPTPLL